MKKFHSTPRIEPETQIAPDHPSGEPFANVMAIDITEGAEIDPFAQLVNKDHRKHARAIERILAAQVSMPGH